MVTISAFTDDLTFSHWAFDFAEPSIQQLRVDYPDNEIKADIELKQLRGYRNKLLTPRNILFTGN